MAGLEFDFRFREPRQGRRSPADAFRVLVLGDFSQKSAAGDPATGLQTLPVDADDFEALMQCLQPHCQPAATPEPLVFRGLEDFHPDGLLQALPTVAELRASRQRLTDPATRQAEAERLLAASENGGPSPPPAAEDGPPAEQDDDTVGRLLGRAPTAAGAPAPPRSGPLDALLHELVAPYLLPNQTPARPELVAAVDAALSGHLRAVLHDPAFQALEGRWRGLLSLVEATEGSLDVAIEVLDMSRPALAADLETHADDLAGSALHRLLVDDQGPGDAPWSLLICDLSFGPEAADLELLARLGALARQCNAALLAEAGPDLLRAGAGGEGWAALRHSPVAAWIGLAAPRVLGRRPYGPRSEAVEALEFQELQGVPEPGEFLWINPAFTLAGLLIGAFLEAGWDAHPEGMVDIADLPLALYEAPEGRALQPCAESVLTHAQAAALLDQGVMPLQAWRDRNALRLLRWQSVADPPSALAGPWAG